MGLACNIIRNGSDRIERVLAPNGMDSRLYGEALEATGSEEKALETWATAYTPGFEAYYGNWENARVKEMYPLDGNGEPRMYDVLGYLRKNNAVIGNLDKDDVKEINNMMAASRRSNLGELLDDMEAFLTIDGRVSLNYNNMVESSLYTELEARRLMEDGMARMEAEAQLQKILDFYRREETADLSKEIEVFQQGQSIGWTISEPEYDRLGKSRTYTDGDVDLELRRVAGGVEANSIPLRIREGRMPALTELYGSDPEFKNYVDTVYPRARRIQEVVVTVEGVESITPEYSNLLNFSHPNLALEGKMREAIRKAMIENTSRKEVEDIERMASEFGIDITGLASLYELDRERARDFLASLDAALPVEGRGIDIQAMETLAGDMAYFLLSENAAEFLPAELEGKDVVRMRTGISPIEAFDRYGLLEVGENLYVRSTMDVSSDEVYDVLAETAVLDPGRFPLSTFPARFVRKGALNRDMLAAEGATEEVRESLRRYVLSMADSFNSEGMVVSRLALGLPARPRFPTPLSVEHAAARLKASVGKRFNIQDSESLFEQRTRAKQENGTLWNNFFKFVRFNSDGSMTLTTDDPSTLRRMENELEGNLKDKIEAYALITNDPSWDNLFPREDLRPEEIADDARYIIYANHPRMLEEYKGDYEVVDGHPYIKNTYDNFIRIGQDVYIKVNEAAEGSIYDNPKGSALEISKKIFSGNPPSIPSDARGAEEPGITDTYDVDTSRLSLEC